jgi:hypothetical protein
VQISSFQILLCFIVSVVVAILFLPSLRLPLEYGIYVQAATATQITTTTTTTITSPDLAKVIIDNAIQELQSDNINKTITHLRAYKQKLSLTLTGNNNHDHYFPFQSLLTLLLVKDVIQSLENGDTTRAAVFLNLADQQLGRTLLNILLLPDATNITVAAADSNSLIYIIVKDLANRIIYDAAYSSSGTSSSLPLLSSSSSNGTPTKSSSRPLKSVAQY